MGNLIIGGIKHSGKTRLGRLLARARKMDFMDLDETMLQEQAEETIRELWNSRGESAFRHLETRAAHRLVIKIRRGKKDTVLSLGGGTIENPRAMSSLEQLEGLRIYLRGDEEMLYQRIMAKGHPPLLGQNTPREDFSRLYETRDPLYTQFADLVHKVRDITPEENAHAIQKALENYHARK